MAWLGGPNWQRSEPTASMLRLLEQLHECGGPTRICDLARRVGRNTTDLRKSLTLLLKLGLVLRTTYRAGSEDRPLYSLTNKGLIYLGQADV